MGLAGRSKFLVALLNDALQIEHPLAEVVDFALGVCGIEWAETDAVGRVSAEQLGQTSLEVADALLEAAGVLVQVRVVSQQGPAADGRGGLAGIGTGRWWVGGSQDRGVQVRVAVDERAVHPRLGGDRGDA